MKNNKAYIEGLILKQLQREISADEQRELHQWLDAGAANREEYAAFMKIWEAGALVLRAPGFDAAAALARVNERLRQGSVAGLGAVPGSGLADTAGPGGHLKVVQGHRWLVAAAACMVLAIAGWWLY